MPPTRGPLTRCPANPRYFADADGRPVFLAGLHTWNNLQDMGPSNPPAALDVDRYLAMLVDHDHNFTRLWMWPMMGTWNDQDWVSPFPWQRTGPGLAADGKPRFDLTRFDESFFARLRDRVTRAAALGIYVSVMLFDSWSANVYNSAPRERHCFAGGNNINGIDILPSADTDYLRAWCTLDDPAVLRLQEAYVRRLVETVNDCDNVLYEISNEAGKVSHSWQEHLTAYIREVEAGLPCQHPLGQTGGMGTYNRCMFASTADYVAPDGNATDGGGRGYTAGAYTWGSAPFDHGDKVVILDTDHLWGIGGDTAWAWKSACRGYNLLYMDPCTDQPWRFFNHPIWAGIDSNRRVRAAFGAIRRYAARLNLAAAVPMNTLCTSTYCLAEPGAAYLAFQPDAGPFSLDLAPGNYRVEWHDPATGETRPGDPLAHPGSWVTFTSAGEAVVFVERDVLR